MFKQDLLFLLLTALVLTIVSTKEDEKSKYRYKKEVVVIGGGMAGMAAARRLLQDGSYNVKVFEAKRDRYGGKIWTNRAAAKDVTAVDVEFGASVLNTKANSKTLLNLVKSFELKTVNSGSIEVRYQGNDEIKVFSGENATELLKEAFVIMKNGLEKAKLMADKPFRSVAKESLENWLRENSDVQDKPGFNRNLLKPLIESFPSVVYNNFSSKLYDINLDLGWDRILVDGVDTLLDRIVSGSSGDDFPIKVELGKVLRNVKVDHERKKVLVRTTDRKQATADAVVIAVPLGVLKSDAIWFEPRLSDEWYKAINEIGVGYSGKVIISFDEPFWPQNVGTFFACSDTAKNGFLQSWFNAYRISGNPFLIGKIVGDQARTWEEKSRKELQSLTLKVLDEIFGHNVLSMRKVTLFQYTSWSTDEFIQGSASYPKVGNSASLWKTLRKPACPHIYFAGGFTESDNNMDSLHAAYDSGVRAAEQIIDNVCKIQPNKDSTKKGDKSNPSKKKDTKDEL